MIKRIVSRVDLALDLLDKIPGRGANVLYELFDSAIDSTRHISLVNFKSRICNYIDTLVDVEILSEIEGSFLKSYLKFEIKCARRYGGQQSKFKEAFKK